ncbi:MAG: PaaI family thioesterase, partial [Roseovarius gahaiensis]
AILDSCMGCAVMTKVPRGSVYTTLEYKVNITRAIPLGLRVRATGVVDHAGRSTGVASGEIRGIDDGKLYATGSTTCLIMKLR